MFAFVLQSLLPVMGHGTGQRTSDGAYFEVLHASYAVPHLWQWAKESGCDAFAPSTTPRGGHHAAEMALNQVEMYTSR